MAHRGGAGRQEPSILWIGRVIRHELITLTAQSQTLANRVRLQISLNLLSRNMSLPCQKGQGRHLSPSSPRNTWGRFRMRGSS